MKKTHLLVCFYILSISGILFSSCSSQDNLIDCLNLEESSVKYESLKKNSLSKSDVIFKMLFGNSTRAEERELKTYGDVICNLLSMPENKLDSLKRIYCTEESLSEYDRVVNIALDTLSNIISDEEIDNLFRFAENYSAIGGNSPVYLQSSLSGKSSITQELMIQTAVKIDISTSYQITSLSTKDYCLRQAALKLGTKFLETTLLSSLEAELETATIDPVLGAVEMGIDVGELIIIVLEYVECCEHPNYY